jgi:hypothetical protein
MTSSMFVSKICVVGVLALSALGCSSGGSGSSSSGDYQASKNGCKVTFSGAYTGSGACKDFSAEDQTGSGAYIVLGMQDQPATGFIGSFSANIVKGFSNGTFGAADGTMNYVLQTSDGSDGFTATDGALKIDSADHWGNGALYEVAGSITIDMQPGTGLKSTTPLHVVITF